MTRSTGLAVTFLALVLGARDAHAQAASASAPSALSAAPRPYPYPVLPPAEFQAALTKGTRTTTGKPGAKYWQQWSTYKLNAKVDVERHTLEGTGRIIYYNRSPDTLSNLVFHLYQNLHL